MKRLAICGATGSIGTQALEVVAEQPDRFRVSLLSGHSNTSLLAEQARRFRPDHVVVTEEKHFSELREALSGSGTQVHAGHDALCSLMREEPADVTLCSMVGFAGLRSTLAAVDGGKQIALANKESLVVAGALVMERVRQTGATLIPVDSEHSAIFQCLVGEDPQAIEKVVLTASGGPFLGRKPNFLQNVRATHALQHPNWTMGAKISIDSATLMNKGLEMIEAKWLFGLENDQIEVVVHPQSIIHSLVQFRDGSLKAQLGLPDMKLPIQYALAWPERIANSFKRFEFRNYPSLTFEPPDTKTFRNLALAREAMEKGGNAPCVLNAANEVLVQAFLDTRIGFMEISNLIEQTLDKIQFIAVPTMEDLLKSDQEARNLAQELIRKSQLSAYY